MRRLSHASLTVRKTDSATPAPLPREILKSLDRDSVPSLGPLGVLWSQEEACRRTVYEPATLP
jgi:hypothetical protein